MRPSPSLTECRDHVELPEDFLEKAKEKLELHMSNPVAADKRGRYESPITACQDSHSR